MNKIIMGMTIALCGCQPPQVTTIKVPEIIRETEVVTMPLDWCALDFSLRDLRKNKPLLLNVSVVDGIVGCLPIGKTSCFYSISEQDGNDTVRIICDPKLIN